MRIRSDSFSDGGAIPDRCAFGRPGAAAPCVDSDNRNPHLAWDDVPADTRSFALVCVDPDAPTVFDDAMRPDREIRADLARRDFIHWTMADLPASVREIAEGACSSGVVHGGKRDPAGPAGSRQGLNDYGSGHFGYDGPCPPWNDARPHRYCFRLYALDRATLELPARFGAADLQRAMRGHVLAEAAIHGAYTLNARLRNDRGAPG